MKIKKKRKKVIRHKNISKVRTRKEKKVAIAILCISHILSVLSFVVYIYILYIYILYIYTYIYIYINYFIFIIYYHHDNWLIEL